MSKEYDTGIVHFVDLDAVVEIRDHEGPYLCQKLLHVFPLSVVMAEPIVEFIDNFTYRTNYIDNFVNITVASLSEPKFKMVIVFNVIENAPLSATYRMECADSEIENKFKELFKGLIFTTTTKDMGVQSNQLQTIYQTAIAEE